MFDRSSGQHDLKIDRLRSSFRGIPLLRCFVHPCPGRLDDIRCRTASRVGTPCIGSNHHMREVSATSRNSCLVEDSEPCGSASALPSDRLPFGVAGLRLLPFIDTTIGPVPLMISLLMSRGSGAEWCQRDYSPFCQAQTKYTCMRVPVGSSVIESPCGSGKSARVVARIPPTTILKVIITVGRQ